MGSQKEGRNSGKGGDVNQRNPSRLQRRAPASIQINPASSFASDWKVAIPLLSPLALSPTSPPLKFQEPTGQISSSSSRKESSSRPQSLITTTAVQTAIDKSNLNTWQHPGGPFHYDPTKPSKFVPSFVPSCR